ncbi:MAG TPA: winged helix-turn-helix transcriptional regulator [archaeon]|nr:winged helix-turn-helix transcriptional regulator [archaeon]
MDSFEEALALDVRKKIYNEIEKAPGLHFREIQRRAGLATGAMQYHLEYLTKRHIIKIEKDGKFVRYFAVRGPQLGEDTKLMSLLRKETVRKILIFLLTKKRANNLTISRKLALSPSSVSWQVEKLLAQGVLEKKSRGRKIYYKIINPEKVSQLLIAHRKSFLDELVDNFAEIWTQM